MAEATMHEVVRRLHSENSEAVFELIEFDYALDELLRNFEALTATSQEVHTAVRYLATTDDESFERVSAARDRAGRLHASAAQILYAFLEMRNAVRGWDIAEARSPANKPSRRGDLSTSGNS